MSYLHVQKILQIISVGEKISSCEWCFFFVVVVGGFFLFFSFKSLSALVRANQQI